MRSHGASGCLMVELCRQNQALESLHAVLAAATFGADRLAAAQSDEDVLAVLGSVVQAAGLTGLSICVNESNSDMPAWRVAYRWGSAIRPVGTPTMDWSRLSRWQGSFATGQLIAGDLADLPAEEKLLLAPLGICAVAAIPVLIDDHLESLVIFEDIRQGQGWTESHQDILRLAAWSLVSGLRRQGQAEALDGDAIAPAMMGNLAVSCVDDGGIVRYWSQGAETIFGRTSHDVLGRPWAQVAAPHANLAEVAREIEHLLSVGQPAEKDLPYQRPDGSVGRLLLAAWPVELAGGGDGLMLAGVDMTAIRQRQETDAQLGRESLQAHKMDTVSQLVSGLAHHTNNALTVIQGNAELIRSMNPDNADLAGMIDEILKAGKNTASLMSRLEAYSQQADAATAPVDLHALLTLLASEMAGQGQVRLDLQAENHVLRASDKQLREALVNLISNAQDAIVSGGEITITTENVDFDEAYCALQTRDIRPGEYLCVTVEDTGAGMDNQTLQRAFEPFFTTKAFGQGHGLGLATVYGCVRNHHGTVLLTSTLGEGTTVQLFLPVAVESNGGGDELEVTTESRKAQILMIENDPVESESLFRILTGSGYGVTRFADGQMAMEHLASQHGSVDGVIIDANAPGIGMMDLLTQVRSYRDDMPCLVSSALLQASQVQMLLDAGVMGFLSKPFRADAVTQLLRRAIKSR